MYCHPEPGMTEEDQPQQCFVQHITMEEYENEAKQYTKTAVNALKQSEEYQRWFHTCLLCNCCWYDGQFTPKCTECGGFATHRPCPVCLGKCHKIWERDVEMSHSFHEAHWTGECSLSLSEQEALLMRHLVDSSENVVLEAMEDLNTG